MAAVRDGMDITQLLIDKGADVNKKDNNDCQTALMSVVKFSNVETAQMLIENGADVNEKDNNGRTAINFATEKYAGGPMLAQMVDILVKNNGTMPECSTMSDYPIISFVGTCEIMERQGDSLGLTIDRTIARCASCEHVYSNDALHSLVTYVHNKQQGVEGILDSEFATGVSYKKIKCGNCNADKINIVILK